ncbi:hypothetical protein [Terriglobus sp. ADX1]|uniref:hypothetical protein n=1 Tax=Terriglobus sp. ADX1 TaxID=2794063 RepID=UPI002FE66166
MPTGYVPITANNIADPTGNKLSDGVIEVLVTNIKDVPLVVAAGGGGSAVLPGSISPIVVTNGAIPGGCQVIDTSVTMPANCCLRLTVKDGGGKVLRVMRKVQTQTGVTLNLDTAQPNTDDPLALIVAGPQGPAGPPGASADIIAQIEDDMAASAASASAAAASANSLLTLVQPVSTVALTKAAGASPEVMPAFQLVANRRIYSPIGDSYYTSALRPWSAGQGYYVGAIGGFDGGTEALTATGLRLEPFSGTGAASWGVWTLRKRIQTSFETATVVVDALPTYSTGEVRAFVGMINSDNTWIFACYDFNGNKLSVRLRMFNGTIQTLGEVATGSNLAAGDTISCVVDGPYVYTLQTKPDGSQYRSSIVNLKPYIDPRDVANFLEGFNWCVGLQSVGSGNGITFKNFSVSNFGGVGLRDYSWVTYEDGTPYEEEGLFYFTATLGGYNDGTSDAVFAGSHMGVFTFDPLSYRIKQVGRVLWSDTAGALRYICGHHAGQIVFDRTRKCWMVTATSFGLFDRTGLTQIVGDTRYTAPLVGTHIMVANAIAFPGGHSTWDAQWMLVGSTWYVAATVDDGTGKSKVGLYTADLATPYTITAGSFLVHATANAREGTKLVNTGGGTVRLLAGETNTSTVYVYTLSPFAVVGSLTTPNTTALGTPAQHFDLIANFNKGSSEYFALMFGTDSVEGVSYTWGTTEIARNGNGGELAGYGFDRVKVAGRTT